MSPNKRKMIQNKRNKTWLPSKNKHNDLILLMLHLWVTFQFEKKGMNFIYFFFNVAIM